MIISGIGFLSLLPIGAIVFGIQDRSIFKRGYWVDFFQQCFTRNGLIFQLFACMKSYIRLSFHPKKQKNDHLIEIGLQFYQEALLRIKNHE